jgi:hypothetical protein
MAAKKSRKAEAERRRRRVRVDVPAAELEVFKAIVLMATSPGTVAERLRHAFERHLAVLRLYALPKAIEAKERSIARRLTSKKMHPLHVKDGLSRAWVTTRTMHWKTAHRIAKDVVELHKLLEWESDRLSQEEI